MRQHTHRSSSASILVNAILLLVCMGADRASAPDRPTLDDLLQPESGWSGRIQWNADDAGKDQRDWFMNFHITTRTGNTFQGRMDIGADGRAPARSVALSGSFKQNLIEFTTVRQGNSQLHFRGKSVGRKLQLGWDGTDVSNRSRTGTATLELGQSGTQEIDAK